MRQKFTAICAAVLLLCGQAWADVDIDAVNFPDDDFRDYVSENFDTDDSGVLEPEEIEQVTAIPVGLTYNYDKKTTNFSDSLSAYNGNGIHDLTGIEHFTQLKALSFREKNESPALSELDLSSNTKLEALQWKSQNPIDLNLTNNTELKYLYCLEGSVSSLKLPNNDSLLYLNCRNNGLTELDLTNSTNLEYLDVSYNNITVLDASDMAQLLKLYCSNNADMTELDLPSEKTKLQILECQSNALGELDLSGFTSLEELRCNGNHISYLELADSKIDSIPKNRIGDQTVTRELPVSKIIPDGGYEYAFSLTQLGIADASKVATFTASDSAGDTITSDFPGTGARIRLESLPDTVKYEYSVGLSGGGSQNMDVTLSSFKEVVIDPPAITKPASDTLPSCKELQEYNQTLTASGATPISWDIQGLPEGLTWQKENADGSSASISGTPTKPGTYEVTVILTNEAGKVEESLTLEIVGLGIRINATNFPDRNFRQYVLSNFDKDKDEYLSFAESSDVTAIDLADASISNMKGIEQFTALESLAVPKPVKKLDIRKNTALVTLNCSGCGLTELDLTKNTALTELDVTSNDLAKLDLKNNTSLQTLKCAYNKLPELDLENNTDLMTLECSPQNIAGTVTTSTNAEYPYKFSVKSLIASDNLANVDESSIAAYDRRSREIDFTYDEGVIYFKTPPATVEYNYNTETPSSDLMSVTAEMTQDLDPQITSRAKLTDGQKNRAYSFDIQATGTDPFTWTVYSGSLPEGLTLSEDTGIISGTPQEWDEDPFTFTVRLTGGKGGLAFREFSLKINPADTRITTSNIPGGISGATYSFQFEAYDPEDEHTWSLSDGTLPRGLALDSEGIISGTPSDSGTYTFTVSAEGPGGTASKEFTMTIADLPDDGGSSNNNSNNNNNSDSTGSLAITTGSLTKGTINIPYSYQLSATGTKPIRWGISGGKLPLGLSVSSSGEVSGTPRTSGAFTFTVTARNSQGYTTKELNLTITTGGASNAPDIITQGLANGYTGIKYSAKFQANGAGTITWRVSKGSLPSGLTLNSDGTLSGTPSKAGQYVFTVEASNSWGKDTMECTLNIYASQSNNDSSNNTGNDGSNSNNNTGTDEPDPYTDNNGNTGNNGTLQGLVTGRSRTIDSLTAEELAETSNETHTIVAVLPTLTVNIAGTYEVVVELLSSAPVGQTLAWHPFPQNNGDASDVYFTDYRGNPITTVPENRVVHVVAYFEIDTYRPVLTVTTASSNGNTGTDGNNTSSSGGGGGGGCSSSAGALMLLALLGLLRRKQA